MSERPLERDAHDAANERGTWFARALAVVCAFDVAAMTQVPWVRTKLPPLDDPFFVVAESRWIRPTLTVTAWAALYAFARAPERIRAALIAIASAFVLQETLSRMQGVHEEPFFQPVGALLGWVLAVLLARTLAHRDGRALLAGDERRAGLTGATAVVGATYFNAAVSKLLAEGIGWAWNPMHVRVMTLAHQPVPPNMLDDIVIGALGRSATLGRLAATFTLVVELGGAVFALSPRFRRFAIGGLLVWHAGLLYMTGICFYGGLVLLVCLGFRSWPRHVEQLAAWTVLGSTRRPSSRAMLLAIVTVGALVSIPSLAMSRLSARTGVALLVAFVFLLVAVASIPWRRIAVGEHESATLDAEDALRPLDRRAAVLVMAALAAIVAGGYLVPLRAHEHHYTNVPRYP